MLIQLLIQPGNCGFLIGHEQRELNLFYFSLDAGSIIFIDLIRQEVHVVALEESLVQSFVEIGGIQRHRNALYDVVGNHAIEEQIGLAFGNNFNPFIANDNYRNIRQVLSNKIPRSLL